MRSSRTGLVLTVAAAAVFLVDCSGDLFRSNPGDVEEEAPSVATGECDGVPIFDRDHLIKRVPRAGTIVALDGVPRARIVCTLKACDTECCNECGSPVGCPYALPSDEGDVCLSHPDFQCGGMDCALECNPFSSAPQHRYRFVGKVVYEPAYGEPTLEVQKFCRID
jgi:hypothetical protein